MIYTGYYSKVKEYEDAGYRTVSISITKPDGVCLTGKIPELCPSLKLFQRYRYGDVTEKEYTREYLEQLDKIGIREILMMIHTFGENVVLLCWEAPGRFCHRHILADYINKNSKLTVDEFPLENKEPMLW